MSTDPRTRSWVEIQPQALRRNLRRIREAIGGSSAIIPMVKADGYGLGMEQVVETVELDDPLGYGVATLEEGLRLLQLREDLLGQVGARPVRGRYRAAARTCAAAARHGFAFHSAE